jgi:predicted permease
MAWFDRLRNTLWRRGEAYGRIAEEQELHLALLIEDLIAGGMDPAEARAAALRRFGNPLALRDRTLDADRLGGLEDLLRDLRLAVRALFRRKGLAATAVGSLALGLGAAGALFSVVDAVLLRPLALPEPDRLIAIVESKNGEESGSNPARLGDWGAQVTGVAAAAGFYGEGLVLTGLGDPERLSATRSLGSVSRFLGVQPLLGRLFTAEEEAGRGAPVALVGEGLWRRRFGADPDLVGRSLTLSGAAVEVIGVLPDGLGYPEDRDLLLPAPVDVQEASRKAGFFTVVARLQPGVAPDEVQAQLDTVARRLASQYPDTDAGRAGRAAPLADHRAAGGRLPLLVLCAAVGLVLLITCVNIASLLLARAAERRREAAVRVALGAGRGGLLRLYLAESLVLALAGCGAGLLLAWAGLPVLVRLLPADLPRLAAARLDGFTLLFSVAAALLCGLAFGLAPAWQAGRLAPGDRLRDGVRAGASAESLRARRLLVGAQVVLSAVLLAGVGLLAKSLLRMESAPLGFRPDRVLTVALNFPWDTPKDRLDPFYADALESFAAIPGVRAAGFADRLPFEGGSQSGPLAVQGGPLASELAESPVSHRAATPGYFGALGILLRAGRLPVDRGPGSGERGPREALINEALAARYFPAGDALGRRITFDTKPEPGETPTWFEVVGIVGDVRLAATEIAAPPEVFVLPRDTYWPMARFALRAQGDPAALAAAVRAAVRRLDPELVIDGLTTLDEQVAAATAGERTRVRLLAAFAGVALWLVALGLYGVLASDVARRTPEIGLRLALGAGRHEVAGAILGQALAVVLAALAIGLAAAVASARLLRSLLYGVEPVDLSVLLAVSLVLLAVAAVASLLPARRAAGIDPGLALRHE